MLFSSPIAGSTQSIQREEGNVTIEMQAGRPGRQCPRQLVPIGDDAVFVREAAGAQKCLPPSE